MTITDEPHGGTGQLDASIPLPVPNPFVNLLMPRDQAVEPSQNHRRHMFGNGQAIAFGGVNQGDVLALSKFNINPILPRSCPRDPLQGLGAVQDLCVQFKFGTHDQAMHRIIG